MARFDDLYERFRKKRKEKGTGYSGAEPFPSARNAVTVTPETSDYTGTGRFAGILEKARKNGVSFSGVDENYIQSFMQDAQSFVKKSQQESQSLTWAGATSQEQYDNRVKTMQDLGSRADAVRVYLNANKGKINPEWYDYLSGFLRDFDSDTQSIFETFHGAKGYYSQWDSQEAYDSYETERAVYNEKSKADLSKLSVELENMKAQVEHARQIQAQIGAFNPYAYADSSSAIAAEKELKDKLAEITAQWGGMEGMEAAYSEKQQYYTTAKRIQDGKKLEEAANNEDFAAMSGYQSTELDNWLEKVFSESGLGYGDVTHEYINADPQKREELLLAYSKFAGEQTDLDKYLVFDNMSATEIGIYNYYYNKEGKEKAQEYLNHIAESLNYRMAEQYLSQYQGNALAEILLGIEVGADQFQTGMKGLWNSVTGNEEYIPATTTQILGGFVREDLKDSGWNLPEWAGGASLGQMAYDLLSTTTNMVPSLAVSGVVGAINPTAGAAVGAGLLGASAAGNAYTEMINQGFSKQQARTYSALVGSSEAGLSYLLGGIGKLGGKLSGNVIGKIVSKVDNIFGKVAVKLGGTMLSEGMEEGLQEVLTPWFKQIATNIEQDVNWEEVAYSSLLGSLSGLLMEGPGAVQSARSETGGTGGTKSQENVKIDAEWALETQPESRVEETEKKLTMGEALAESAGIREQLRNNQDKLAALQAVADIETSEEFAQLDISGKKNWVIEKLRPTGYKVERKGFGIIEFAKKRLKSAFNYFENGSADEVAFEAIPFVLENGVEITKRDTHKGRNYGTVTIAAPITINGKRGNMAVVVKKTDGNYYKVHRILTPDGSVFELVDTKREAKSTPTGEAPKNGSLATSKDFASETIVNENLGNVKPEVEGVMLPTKEDIARMEAGEGVQGAQEPGQEAQAPEERGFPTREDVAQMEAGEEPRSRVEEVGLPMPEGREDQAAQSRERTRRAEEILGDKGSYMSKNAAELYEELSGLKKGVKASSRLGYILDHGYEWRSIKTALLNIRDNPSEVVNPNSQAEAMIREVLGREYDNTVEDLSRPDEVTNQYAEKLWNIKTEIANNQRLREENMADYQEEIDRLQEMYDGKANKTTKAANDILRRIERVTRMKNTVDGDYTRRIERLQERVDKMDTDVYRRAQQRRSKQAQYEREVAELIGDTSTWKDKKLGVSYWTNTLRRNLRDVVRDENGERDIEKAYAIYDYLQGQYNHDEAGRKRETAKIKNPYAELEITKEEDAYIQMLGELRHNPSTELSLEVVEEYYEKHKKHIDKAKVDKAIEMSRKTYDELFARLNKRLREQGMKEIPYRKGYFPHFTEDAQGPIAKFLNWKTKNNEIPTDIAGLTEGFNPERSWQSFNKERTGDSTTYSFLRGMDTYVQGALDWIYHIEDIQRRRALENYIRYVHSDEGIRARIDEIKANEEYDADEAQQMIDAVLAEAKNPLGNFVQDLRTGTNILAGKKNTLDRGVESATNRKIYSVMTNLSNRVSANMVAGSISSAFTNFIPITQSWGQVSPISSLKAMLGTIRSAAHDDGVVDKSDFLTNRLRNPDNLYKGTWDKISDKVGWLMEAVDNFTSQTVWRSKYMENIAAGMSEAEAIKDADQFAENVLAGRSRGNMPTAFNAKNPIAKVATAFQLEVANQYGYILKDMPQDMKKETTGKLVKGYATMFLGAYLYNMAFSALTGRDSALDPIGIIERLIRGLTDEEEEPEDAILGFAEDVLQEVPFVGGLMGGGRVPLSSALPYDGVWGMVEGLTQDIGSGDWKSVLEELSNPLYYLVSPMGGGQIRKTAQGLGMYFNEVPGSYTYDENGEPQLRFPVEEGIAPWLQAALFGKWSGQNAQQYLEEGRKPLSAKQTREFFESGMTIQEYWDYRDEMTKLKKQDEKLALINGMDITEDQKRVLKSYLFDEEKYAEENQEKYAFLEEEGIGYLGWKELPDDAKDAWDWAFENQDKAVMGDVFADGVVEYRKYTKAMSELKADKDADGKTVAGSRKQKVTDYINSLDIDYGEKIILYVTEFSSTASRDMYGSEIVEYLNGRNDISEKQIREILKQLGFEVAEDGRVTWE